MNIYSYTAFIIGPDVLYPLPIPRTRTCHARFARTLQASPTTI